MLSNVSKYSRQRTDLQRIMLWNGDVVLAMLNGSQPNTLPVCRLTK